MNMDIKALQGRITSAPDITTDVVDDLNVVTQLLLESDPPAAYDNAQRTIRDAYSIGYAPGESQALIYAGTAASKQRQFDEAIILYQRAIRIKQEINDVHGVAATLTKMGNTELRAGNYDESLAYYRRAIDLMTDDDELTKASVYANSATILGLQGNYTLALKSHLKALKTYEAYNDTNRVAGILANIGLIYIEQQNYDEAMKAFDQALHLQEDKGDALATSDLLSNIGIVYHEQKKYDEALEVHERSLALRQSLDDKSIIAISYSNIGNVYRSQEKYELAEDRYNKALKLFDAINDKRLLLHSYLNLGELYFETQSYEEAHRYLDAAEKLAKETGLKHQLCKAYQYKSMLFGRRKKYEDAYHYHQLFYALDHEISNSNVQSQMAQMSLSKEMEQKEKVAELEREKNIELQKAFNLLEIEKRRSEELLLNILPVEISNELKESGKTKARSFDMATVLFADIKAFTKVSEQFSAEEIVSSIDEYFELFDLIMEKHGAEKIKTIGDAYLCVSGIPVTATDHAEKMIAVAKDMLQAVSKLREKREGEGKHAFDFRIGINSGPVVAGVVGIKKFAYDIWGDTVNTASRMQANGEPGRINISEATYKLVLHQYPCVYRGEINAKNKGELKMYFVD